MPIECDVCRDPASDPSDGADKATAVQFGDRTAMLCEAHRTIAEQVESSTFEHLTRYFSETPGRRSYVPRRGDVRESRGRRFSDR